MQYVCLGCGGAAAFSPSLPAVQHRLWKQAEQSLGCELERDRVVVQLWARRKSPVPSPLVMELESN